MDDFQNPQSLDVDRTGPKRVRLIGLITVVGGAGLLFLGLYLMATFRHISRGVVLGTVFLGLGLVAQGLLALLTGRKWMDNPPWVRYVAIVLGIPGFLAALGFGLYLVFRD